MFSKYMLRKGKVEGEKNIENDQKVCNEKFNIFATYDIHFFSTFASISYFSSTSLLGQIVFCGHCSVIIPCFFLFLTRSFRRVRFHSCTHSPR